ncbi:MAG TPA: carboxylate-amine ligase [Dictyobacter sp.]|jgi:carboxylate-amine ligase|nr:carboxylate-amine ligase [Dictyobacter sp.]
MIPRFTLGVEEEFQLVDRNTGQLASRVHSILEKGVPIFGEQVKAEMLQSMIEIITDVCPDIATLRLDLRNRISMLSQLIETEGLALISAGTHPHAHWRDQARTIDERYKEIEQEYQDVGRSIMICGLHVHVGIDQHEQAIPLMNQLRTWLPHLLALSSNSPFWINHYTGIKSYRSIVWKRFPRSGVAPQFNSTSEYDHYIADLIQTGCIDNAKRIWWDIRPHPFFDTIEFRICDMPATLDDTIAIAALCQALVAKLSWLHEHNMQTPVLSTQKIEENKWRATRYGLDAEYVDFVRQRRLSFRDAIHETLDFVDDMLDDLGTRQEINYLRNLLDQKSGTGADRQIAVYNATGSIDAVIRYLMQQTMQGIPLNTIVTTQ